MAFCGIEFNRQREKTFSQRMNEGDHLLVIERERAKARELAGVKIEPGGNVATGGEKGKSRDIVADKIGMSGRTFDKARTIWDKAILPIVNHLINSLSDEQKIPILKDCAE